MVDTQRSPVTADGTGDHPSVARPGPLGWLRAGLLLIAPLLAALWVGATAFDGTLVPWDPRMIDLGVYLRAGEQLLADLPIYDEGSELPFLYPPTAALLAVPMSLLPVMAVQLGWTLLNVVLLLATLHRLGVHGWRLSLGTAAAVLLVEPVGQTFAFGQLGIILVALVVLDLVPGPRLLDGLLGPRRLPAGWASGLGAALKLTPAITVPYLFLAGRRRAALVATGTFVGLGLVAALVLPGSSAAFWGRLVRGDSGLGGSIVYFNNQSILGSWLRVTQREPGSELLGLAVSAVVAALGIWVATLWHRRGKIALAVSLLGVASLLASPVSWGHHFVWVLPLAVVLVLDAELPTPLRVAGFVFAGYLAGAPYERLPGGGDIELTYGWGRLLLASWTPLLGIVLLVVALVTVLLPTLSRGAPRPG